MSHDDGRLDRPDGWPDNWEAPPCSIRQMINILRSESQRIVIVQKAFVQNGTLKEPDEGQLRQAIAFMRAHNFLISAVPYLDQVRDLIARLRLKGPRQ